MTHWFAEGDTPDGPRSIRLPAAGEADQGPPFVIRVGDGPPDLLPASLWPSTLDRVADLAQDDPLDRISGWVRLWLLGLVKQRPGWDGVVCAIHGDVSHWIEVSADEAVSSRSAATLRLCRAMEGAGTVDAPALSASLSRPERLAADLLSAQLAKNGAAVTGHLVGAELAAMRPYWLGRDVALLTDQPDLYAVALAAQGVPVTAYRPELLLHAGLAVLGKP